MKVMLCENADWLLSEEAFSIYASCMYHPTYKDYKGQMDDLLSDTSSLLRETKTPSLFFITSSSPFTRRDDTGKMNLNFPRPL